MSERECLICGEYLKKESNSNENNNGEIIYTLDCPKCGSYYVPRHNILKTIKDEKQKLQLSAYISWHQDDANYNYPTLTEELIKNIISQPFPTPAERAENILRFICHNFPEIGSAITLASSSTFCINRKEINDLRLRGISYSTSNQEILFLTHTYLSLEKNFLTPSLPYKGAPPEIFIITPKGWAHYHDLMQGETESNKVFIASWFDESTKPAIKVVKEVLITMGYVPVDLSDIQTGGAKPGYITEQILVEIKSSKFVIADLTSGICEHHKDKSEKIIPQALARGGVYFEAGYAEGLGKKLILLCNQDFRDKDLIHFDLKQYRHIAWDSQNLEALEKELTAWIELNFGKGKTPVL